MKPPPEIETTHHQTTYRRPTRGAWKALATVPVAAAIWLAASDKTDGLIIIGLLCLAVGLWLANYLATAISFGADGSLGYGGRRIVAAELKRCGYARLVPQGRRFALCSFALYTRELPAGRRTVLSLGPPEVVIPTLGWGVAQREQLFTAFTDWLAGSSAVIDPAAEVRLTELASTTGGRVRSD